MIKIKAQYEYRYYEYKINVPISVVSGADVPLRHSMMESLFVSIETIQFYSKGVGYDMKFSPRQLIFARSPPGFGELSAHPQ